jgi:UDP-N-acetylmuramoylalanine--D-glutamate ligase
MTFSADRAPVLVAGLGLSGIAVVRHFHRENVPVVAWDEKPVPAATRDALPAGVELREGPFDPDRFARAGAVVVSPGISPRHPAIAAARGAGVPCWNEAGLALRRVTLPIVGITGSSGKTTTATLIAEMLAASGKRPFLGGNVGRPLLEVLAPEAEGGFDVVVAELSSFQLEVASPFVPSVAVLTPFHEDHLDRHGSVESYFQAKANLFRWLGPSGVAVLGLHHRTHARFSGLVRGKVHWYRPHDRGVVGPLAARPQVGATTTDRELALCLDAAAPRATTLAFSGPAFATSANRENAAAAALATLAAGGTVEGVRTVLETFRGLPHRLEFVARRDGVAFVNDSKATNTVATAGALRSFPSRSVVLLVGGRNKGLDPNDLLELVSDRCRAVVAFGEAGPVFAEALAGRAPVEIVEAFDDAVVQATRLARPGDTVLLSPACSSHDAFRSYAERGDRFRRLVTGEG